MTAATNSTHDPRLESWVASANDGTIDFPIQNLPYGVFERDSHAPSRIGVAIGDQVVDLFQSADLGHFDRLPERIGAAVRSTSLNALMRLSVADLSTLRQHLSQMLAAGSHHPDARILVPMKDAKLLVPAFIGDYTDFYASLFHATRVGSLFRPDNPLLPNYKYVPIAYHGRASSIVASGTPINRPSGQMKGRGDDPQFGPSGRLDYEAEVGCFIREGNHLGHAIPIDRAEEAIFGVCLVNDWSARDIQAWEYQPLGPFLAKNFATTVSPWVVALEALAPFRTPAVRRSDDPAPLPYLSSAQNAASGAFDITVDVFLRTADMRRENVTPVRLSSSPFREMYWTFAQMVAHHTSNGCNLRPGDLLASGTVSGSATGSEACLLELTRGGTQRVALPSGETRAFLEDGDEIIMRAYCERSGSVRIGFGECTGVVRGPATASPS